MKKSTSVTAETDGSARGVIPGRPGLDRRAFVRLAAGTAVAAGLSGPILGCGGSRAAGRRVIVLGLDGLDPKIVRALIQAGRLPNFKRLAEIGAFLPLQTTMPALSPVAWSSFITGMDPGGHGIADFTMRDPQTYMPVFSIYENREPDWTLSVGDVHLPIKGGGPVNLRKGKPFWRFLSEQGIPTMVSKIPSSFPVEEDADFALSGMGTPDLAGGYGTFSYYTTDVFEHFPHVDPASGYIIYLEPKDGVISSNLMGPVNSLKTLADTGRDPLVNNAKVGFTLYPDPDRDMARLDVQGQTVILEKGVYSDWVKVSFDLLPVVGSVSGIVRFLLKGVHPHVQLYATPINIDPEKQAMPVTHPASYGVDLARDIGSFWTKGLPSDTKAFDYGVLNDEEYVKQAQLILDERMALFEAQWSRFKDGLFYFYVSSTDQDAHMLWRNMDASHPMHSVADVRFSGYIHHLYEQMDTLVGRVLPAVDDQTLLLICSDHGFTQFARQLHLNTWLRDNGYLSLKAGTERKEETSVVDIDWSQTAAYGIGFNGLYLNLKNREGKGIIEPDKAPELLARLRRELEAIVDPDTGRRPVAKVYPKEEVYSGAMVPDMPELLVGYTPGFRCASSSVIGSTGKAILDLNPWAWSGDHSMARDLVPGTLLASRPLGRGNPSILDLPVTILDFFGIERPEQMSGQTLL